MANLAVVEDALFFGPAMAKVREPAVAHLCNQAYE